MVQKQEELDVSRPVRTRAGSSARITRIADGKIYGEYWHAEHGWIPVVYNKSGRITDKDKAIDLVYENPILQGQRPEPSEVA